MNTDELRPGIIDMLAGEKHTKSPMYASFYGLSQSICHHLDLERCPLVMHDNPKIIQRRMLQQNKQAYPYAYIRPNNIGVNKDRQNIKMIQRTSANVKYDKSSMTNTSVTKAFVFPSLVNLELHFVSNDAEWLLGFSERLAILSAIEAFSFKLDLDVATWTVRVAAENSTVDLPILALEQAEDPGGVDIAFPFVMETWMGVFKEVAKINNEGIIMKSYGLSENINGGNYEQV